MPKFKVRDDVADVQFYLEEEDGDINLYAESEKVGQELILTIKSGGELETVYIGVDSAKDLGLEVYEQTNTKLNQYAGHIKITN